MESQPKLRTLFSREELEAAVNRLAAEISRDYGGKCPLLIGVLKGSFIFMADLVRHLDFPLEVDFIALSSYGKENHSSGKVEVVQPLQAAIEGREVLVVEDIVDTGLTTAFLLDYLRQKNPASLKVCALIDKPSQRRVPVGIDYLGLTAPDKFLVGYGLDLNQRFRNLPEVCFIEEGG